MAKDIFLGCAGLLIGLLLLGMVGATVDPTGKYAALWAVVLFPAVIGSAAGFIWLGSLF